MAGFAVVGAIRINTSQLAPQRVEQGRQHLGVMDIFQRHFRRHDIVGHWVYRQMQLAPHSPLLLAVFTNFPFAFAIDFEAGGINDQVSHRALAGEAVIDVDGLGPLADTVVVRRLQRHRHQLEQRVNEAFQGSQRQLEQAFYHQGCLNGCVTVVETPPSAAMVALAMPLLNDLFVHPDGQRTALHQGLIVLLPVADLVLGLTHLMLSDTALQDQITKMTDSSPI